MRKNSFIGINIFSGLGLCYMEKEEDQKAIKFFKLSLHYSREINSINHEAYALNYLSQFYFRRNKIDSSIVYLNEALPIFKRMNDIIGESEIYINLGNAYLSKAQFDKAIYYCTKSHKINEIGNSLIGKSTSCSCLYEAYKLKNDTKNSLFYLEKLKSQEDSLYSISNIEEITTIELNYEHKKGKGNIGDPTKAKRRTIGRRDKTCLYHYV